MGMDNSRKKMKIEIANFIFEFKSNQKRILNILEKRYEKFSIKAKAEFSFEINFLKKPSLPFRPSIIFKEKKWIISRGDFYCVLDMKNKKGALEISPRAQSFDSFLRVLCSWLLINNNGFILHAAAILKNGKGYVFPGKSGAGKSTISKMFLKSEARDKRQEARNGKEKCKKVSPLSPNPFSLYSNILLTDELVPLRIEKGVVKIYGSPFWGEMKNKGKRVAGGIKLEKLFFLKKSKTNAVNKISKSEFYKKILRCVMSFSREKNDFLKISKTISEVCRKIEVSNLKFSNRDDSFFNII